jgi:galacturan 1,4-alpha-galacturonidase
MARRVRRGGRPQGQIKIAIIGGGALGWTPSIVTDLALNRHLGGDLVLFDIDPVALSVMSRYARGLLGHRDAGGRFRLSVTQDRREALRGADFVVITISVGGLAMMAHDLAIPREYGIIQSVGDTVGPGGLIRGLRNVPVFKRLAEDILRHCPTAWVINYTNPMTVLTRTLTREGVKAIGCCHEVFGAQKLIAATANQVLGRRDLQRRDVDVVVTGINHCTVITRATVDGHDALEMVRRYARRPGVVRRYGRGEPQKARGLFARHQVKLEFLRRYGVLPASGDRHTVEFFPGFLTPATFEGQRWGVVVTTIDERIEEKRTDLANRRKAIRDPRAMGRAPLKPSGEEASDMIACLVGAATMKTNVNRPNIGQVCNLPADVVVETNAWLSRDRVEPICSGPIPTMLLPGYLRHVTNQEATIEAALSGDRDMAFQVLLNDALVADRDDAEKMLRRLLAAEADYLPSFFRSRRVRIPRRDTTRLAAIDGALAAGLSYE